MKSKFSNLGFPSSQSFSKFGLRLFIFTTLLILSFTMVAATSTCEDPMVTDTYDMCFGSVSILGTEYGETESSCLVLCEATDTTCCAFNDNTATCTIGASTAYDGRSGYFASECVIDPTFVLDANGVTVHCDGAANLETGVINGITYTKRTTPQITTTNANTTCVSGITDFSGLFSGELTFNQDISTWDVSDATTMETMFYNCREFNQDLTYWDVSGVENFYRTFYNAYIFNGDISTWDVSSATTMKSMFQVAKLFNQSLNSWDVSSVEDMYGIFYATSFDGDISSWNTSSVTTMEYAFANDKVFNQDISGWDVSSLEVAKNMFYNSWLFNQDISGWDTSSLQNMYRMFGYTQNFNQDIGGWNVSSATDMNALFYNADAFYQDLTDWDVQTITTTPSVFATNADLYETATELWPLWGVEFHPPTITIYGATPTKYNVTLAGTFDFKDFENVSTYWYVDGYGYFGAAYDVDEFGNPQYDTFDVTGLDYNTEYNYSMKLNYVNGSSTVSQFDSLTQTYNCVGGTYDISTTLAGTTAFTDECKNFCDSIADSKSLTCCAERNGNCYGYYGASVSTYDGDGSYFASDVSVDTADTWASVTSVDKTFTTLPGDDSFFTSYSASLYNANSIKVNSTITVVDFETDYYVQWREVLGTITNITTNNISSGSQVDTIDSLDANTTYDVRACLNTEDGETCTTWGYITTGIIPTLTINDPTFVSKNNVTLNWDLDETGITDIGYVISINSINISTTDSSYEVSSLEPETNYSYSITANYKTLGFDGSVVQSSTVLTYYENDFDDVWDTLFQGSNIAKILLGMVVLLSIIFGSVAVFGNYNMKLGMYGILIVTVIGAVVAKVMHLFSTGVFLLILVGVILLAVLKNMFGGDNEY